MLNHIILFKSGVYGVCLAESYNAFSHRRIVCRRVDHWIIDRQGEHRQLDRHDVQSCIISSQPHSSGQTATLDETVMHLVRGPPTDVILKNSVNATAKSKAQSCSHTPHHNTSTLRGHLDSSHSGSTATFIITMMSKRKIPHSQHHLVQAQTLGLV